MGRLTDEELDAIEEQCDGLGLVALNASAQQDVRSMIAELRERRAQDLTSEDVDTLRVLRDDVSEFGIIAPRRAWRSRDEEQDADAAWTRRAIALLDKLTRGNR